MTQPEGQTARDIFPEDDGIPEVSQDDFPTITENEDPQFAPLPGDDPSASVDFGTTAAEQSEGERDGHREPAGSTQTSLIARRLRPVPHTTHIAVSLLP